MNIGHVSYSQHTNTHSTYNSSVQTDINYDKQVNVNIVYDKTIHDTQRVEQATNIAQHQRIDVYV